MPDFSRLTYRQKKDLAKDLEQSIYKHKHTKSELNELENRSKSGQLINFNDYNIFDKEVTEILNKHKIKNKKTK